MLNPTIIAFIGTRAQPSLHIHFPLPEVPCWAGLPPGLFHLWFRSHGLPAYP
jgi:hypothetical protein